MIKLSLNDLITLNKTICNKTGEPFNLINRDALLSALSIQDNDYYDDENLMLSALLRSLVLSHGFEQGNKRTAFLALALMKLPYCTPEKFTYVILDIAKGNLKDINEIKNLIYKQGEK